MGKTNWRRVFLGGLLAGIVLLLLQLASMPLFMPQWELVLESLGHPFPSESSIGNIVFGIAFTFILGMATVWQYSAIRPRYGAGPRTAMIAGLFIWIMRVLNDSSYSLSADQRQLDFSA